MSARHAVSIALRPSHVVAPLRPLLDEAITRIAIVRLRVGLGDLLASVPAMRMLRLARPDAHVTLITWEEVRPVVERMAAYVDDLLPFSGYPGIPDRAPVAGSIPAFFEQARARRFHLALQMYGALPAANEVTTSIGAAVTGGFFDRRARIADLSTHMPYPFGCHEIHRHMRLMEFLGAPWRDDSLEFPIRPDDVAERDRLLERFHLEPYRYVCVHPGATAASRRWLPARFAEVGDALARRGRRVVLTGVRGETAPAAVAAAMTSTPVLAAGRTSLGGLAALLATSALLVTNDTGPAQLAAAVRVPSVTVFLAGEPHRWTGLDHSRHRFVRAGVECQPCGLLECPIDFRCARRLSADTVIDVATRLLAPHASQKTK
jgi:ADP-heptose:LPS heptosyltransferase